MSLATLWWRRFSKQGGIDVGDKGKKDKGKREVQKKAKRTPAEKRKLKKDKKADGGSSHKP
jgi:hypothetical protein